MTKYELMAMRVHVENIQRAISLCQNEGADWIQMKCQNDIDYLMGKLNYGIGDKKR